MAAAKKKAAKKKPSTKFTIQFKDPDLPAAMRKFGECGEYFSATVDVNTTTGAGVIKFAKMGRSNG